jgi:hypothetical protein
MLKTNDFQKLEDEVSNPRHPMHDLFIGMVQSGHKNDFLVNISGGHIKDQMAFE